MISMAKDIHKNKYSRHSKTAESFLEAFSNLSMIDGNQSNDTQPLDDVADAADGQVPNQNILNRDTVMKAVDSENFEIAMAGEFEKCGTTKFMNY